MSLGTFQKLIGETKTYELKIFNYFRMFFNSFGELLERVSRKIKYKNARFRKCISAEEYI